MNSFPSFFKHDSSGVPTVEFYLNAASEASAGDRKKLAIHLYLAAFELDRIDNDFPSESVLDGMRNAWTIAMEISDRSSAETLFTELAPYSSPDQVTSRARQLQDMTISQLEEMGIPKDRIEKAHRIYTPEATSAGADSDFISRFFGMLSQDGDDEIPERQASSERDPSGREPVVPQWGRGRDGSIYPTADYDELVGYGEALRSMRVFGFDTAADDDYSQFLQENSIFHGVSGLALYDPFLFYGPSREDVYEFAEATAGEIGNPVITLHVRTDDAGMWTIRLSGPFKRGLLGVSDPTDVPTPCTFIIENIDILQDFMKASIQSDAHSEDGMPSQASRAYGEILGYIHAILQKPDVFPIITSQSDVVLFPHFEDMFDRVQRIKVDLPSFEERKEVWNSFAMAHTSFSGIDMDELAQVSEGVSRHDLVTAGRKAVRDVFQESLTNNVYRFVTINDVLFELVPFVSKNDEDVYSAMEEAAVEAFVDELDVLDFESDDSDGLGENGSFPADSQQ